MSFLKDDFVIDWYLVDSCTGDRRLVAEGTKQKSRLLVAADLAKKEPSNKRLQHLWFKMVGSKSHTDPGLTLVSSLRLACN